MSDKFLGIPKRLIMSTINNIEMETDGDMEATCLEILHNRTMSERDKVAVAFVLGCIARDIVEARP